MYTDAPTNTYLRSFLAGTAASLIFLPVNSPESHPILQAVDL